MKHTVEQVERWIAQQKRAYAAGKLSPEKIAKLEAIPGWTW